MEIMGPVQRGLALLSSLPSNWPIIVVDIKDCFFSIPLCKQDSPRFAFTLPAINSEEPDERFEWVVLPQGMANSPTMCQLFVGTAILPVRKKFPKVCCLHYMDDILLAAREESILHTAYLELVKCLEGKGLHIATEKVQQSQIVAYLGAKILPKEIRPQKVEIRKDKLLTLNDFQKLLGDINWVRGYLSLPIYELKPIYEILKRNSALDSPRALTSEGRKALDLVEKKLAEAFLKRRQPDQPISLCVLPTRCQPTGLL